MAFDAQQKKINDILSGDFKYIMKPKIFIGSSTESKITVEQIKEFFDQYYDCTVWYENFFQLNQSIYDNLLKRSPMYDYAIFVGGVDDLTTRIRTWKTKKAVRDNVYYEFGLYTGLLSKDRTFFFIHKDVKVASDLFGITLLSYNCPEDITKGCQQIKAKIEEEEKINRINLLPSTSLALDYYENYLKPLGSQLPTLTQFKVGTATYPVQKQSLQIIIPPDCNTDWKMWAIEFYNANKCHDTEICGNPRNFSVKFDSSALSNEKELRILDVPQILRASFDAVEMVTGKDFIGYTDTITTMKEKEITNFIKTLCNLMKENPVLYPRTTIQRISDIGTVI